MNWDQIDKEFEELCLRLWPQSKDELLGLANHYDNQGMTITSEQLRLAIQMASQRFDEIRSKRN